MTMPVSRAVLDVVTIARKHAERVDTDGTFPAEAVAELRGSGLLRLALPVAFGGRGAGPVQFVEVMGELAAACGSTAMIYLMHNAAAVTDAAAHLAVLGFAAGRVIGLHALVRRRIGGGPHGLLAKSYLLAS